MPPEFQIENRFIINSLENTLSGNPIDAASFDNESLNWDYIIATSELNGVIPLVSKSLNLFDKDLVPVDVAETFSELNRESAVSNLIKLTELLNINKKFKESGIDSLVLKGAGLGSDVYGDISLRPFGDLDILIREEKLISAVNILTDCGYEHIFVYTDKQAAIYKQSAFYLKDQELHYSFYNPIKKIYLELHWALMPINYSFSQDVEEIFENAVSVSAGQGEIFVPCIEDLIIYLSLHGSKHYWSRLIWVFDIAVFIKEKKNVNWELVIAKSEELNCKRMLLLSVYLANNLFSCDIPKILLNYLKADNSVSVMGEIVISNFKKGLSYEEIEAENKTFFLRSMDSNIDKLLFVSKIIFKPTIYELEAVSLPNKLSFLYYLIRPLRLLKKYLLRLFSNN